MTRLLVVDDNEQNLYMLQVLLRGHGYEVASAGDGAEALEQARRDPPDMIISDILMPVMDGFTLCREWKRDDRLKAIPLVFYTATYTDPKDEELALSLGAERFIVKPVEPDVLVRMLREVIEKAAAGRLVAPREPVEEEAVFFKEYNEALIRKLEDKMLQLEETNRELACEIVERVRAEAESRQKAEAVTIINALNRAINRGDSLQQVIDLLCRETRRIFSSSGAAAYLLSEDRQYLVLQNFILPQAMVNRIETLTGIKIPGVRIPLKAGSWYLNALQAGKPQLTHDPAAIQGMMAECTENKILQKLVPQIYRVLNSRAVMSVPLVTEGEFVGLLDLSRDEPFTESDLARFEAIAGQLTALVKLWQVSDALKRISRQNELLLNSAGEGIYGLDAQGNITFVNPAAAQLLGWELEEIGGRLHHEVVHHSKPDGSPYPREECRIYATLRDGVTRHVADEVFWGKDGTSFPVEYVSTPIREGDELVGAVVTFNDITERKRAEEALRESEGKYRTLVENIPQKIFTKDRDSVYVSCNENFARDLGITPEEFAGATDYDFFPRELADKYKADDKRILESGETEEIEERYVLDGQEAWVRTIKTPTRDEAGNVVGILGIFWDITEQVQAREERDLLLTQIQEQAQRVQQIIDTVPEGVLLLDAKGQVILANPVAERDLAVLADAKAGEVLTRLGERPLAELLTSPPKGLWHEVKAGRRTFEIIARPIGNGPEPEDWVLVISEVTRAREIQEQLQQQERLAAVGQLAAGIAHDFNNIMAAIVLYAQLAARSRGLSDRDREGMAIINQQAWHATRLIQQILDFSRPALLKEQPLDLLLLLKEQVKLLQRTLPEHIEIDLAYGRGEYAVKADPTRMQQMIMNLAVNARDAMPEGGSLRIELERIKVESGKSPLLPEMEAGEWVKLTVSDTGTGIAPDVRQHIFEPFFTTKGPGEGSGLGLAQVYGIVGQHGGRIDVETQVGEGTTFTICLPALAVYSVEPFTLDVMTVPEGRGEVVLVVEDEATVRTALVKGLEHMNYKTLEAANGEQALAVMEKHGEQVALVLSDVVMPVMGGIALLHALRQKGWEMPVLLLTGHSMGRELKELGAQGLTAWLLKPPTYEQLAQAVASALSA